MCLAHADDDVTPRLPCLPETGCRIPQRPRCSQKASGSHLRGSMPRPSANSGVHFLFLLEGGVAVEMLAPALKRAHHPLHHLQGHGTCSMHATEITHASAWGMGEVRGGGGALRPDVTPPTNHEKLSTEEYHSIPSKSTIKIKNNIL